jgi:hypothetical protein
LDDFILNNSKLRAQKTPLEQCKKMVMQYNDTLSEISLQIDKEVTDVMGEQLSIKELILHIATIQERLVYECGVIDNAIRAFRVLEKQMTKPTTSATTIDLMPLSGNIWADIGEKMRKGADVSEQLTPDEIEQLKADFEREFNSFTSYTPSFCTQVQKILVKKGCNNPKSFQDETHLDENVFGRIKRGEHNDIIQISFAHLIAICFGLNVDLKTADNIISAAGYTVGDTKERHAYHFLLTAFKGRTIEDCNNFLSRMGLPLLGSDTENKENKENKKAKGTAKSRKTSEV